jgi:hypothetical protein
VCGSEEDGTTKNCVIANLRNRGFQTYAHSTKVALIKAGPPRPTSLPFLATKKTQRKNGIQQVYFARFNPSVYSREPWICACALPDQGGLFCWPCLLFNASPNIRTWKSTPYKDMNNLSGEISRHSKIETHLAATLALSKFNGNSAQRIDLLLDKAREQEISNHNQQVKY